MQAHRGGVRSSLCGVPVPSRAPLCSWRVALSHGLVWCLWSGVGSGHRSAVDRLAALAAAANAKVDKGKALLALDSCIYHGSAPVSNSKGDATLDEAKPRIERTVNGTAAAALPCNVVVYGGV